MVAFIDPPSQPVNVTFSGQASKTSYQLVWKAPNDTYNCVSFYLINTTSSELLLHTTDTSVLITRPAEDPANTTYTVSVAAVDMFNRKGKWSEPLCFLFEGLPMNLHNFASLRQIHNYISVPSAVISSIPYFECMQCWFR